MSRKALLVVTRVGRSDLGTLCPDGANGPGWTQAQEGDVDKFEENTPRNGDLTGIEPGVGLLLTWFQ